MTTNLVFLSLNTTPITSEDLAFLNGNLSSVFAYLEVVGHKIAYLEVVGHKNTNRWGIIAVRRTKMFEQTVRIYDRSDPSWHCSTEWQPMLEFVRERYDCEMSMLKR